ncbi:phage portal protein, partial [Clostridioides sp. ZZV15-6598]|uniref:phage portal protein n=1 Tax=Clostridioides sp. ZZV15-6598 TaxID=2811501 RepID=UPI001D11738E|nr:phage portal protein [Clostridioides sp. ZZV15-6598]
MLNKTSHPTVSNLKHLEYEIDKWKTSNTRKEQLQGERYYKGEHDILRRKRTVIGEGGKLTEVENLPNNKIVDNKYANLVDQKVNYLLGKPLTFQTQNEVYNKLLKDIFNKKFLRAFKNLCEDSLNGGISWLHPYYSEEGKLSFKRFPSYEVLPFWKDSEHTILDFAVRLYEVKAYSGANEKIIEKVEVYSKEGIKRYILQGMTLIADSESPYSSYLVVETDDIHEELNWDRIPLIPFKYNNKEIPLIKRVKSLQDGINIMLSDFENNMQEDARNTILVLQNYDGQNLGEFRKNLAQYGAVKVRTVDGAVGDLKTLEIKVNSDNYKSILEVFKKALIENGRGYDAKDDRMSGNPNQMNIQSMYSDIDLDANGMETEFQASFEELLWFVNMHLLNTSQGNYENEEVEIIFNRDILINETESI